MAKVFTTQFKQAKTTVDRLGNTQLRVGRRFKISGWLLFDGIALIIIISIATLRLTHAGLNYSFERTPAQMQGGSLTHSVVSGDYRRLVSSGIHAEASAVLTAQEVGESQQVCAQLHVNSKDTFIDIQLNGHYANAFVSRAADATVCVDVNHEASGGTVYAGTSGNADVQRIYGIK